jgi:RNA polymerase sigma-70 factor (ECF subfamily)
VKSDAQNDIHDLVQAGYRYSLALTHHHYDAEDLVQQAWLKLTHRYGQVKHRSILYTAIRRLFYDRCRRGKIVSFGPLEESPEPISFEPTSSCDDLDVLLAGLRPEEREALYLNAVEDYTTREIAEQTGFPRNTVLSLIHRARRKLSRATRVEEQALKNENQEEP